MALVRAHFGVDPARLSPAEFARLVGEAAWIEHYRAELMAATVELGVGRALQKAFSKR